MNKFENIYATKLNKKAVRVKSVIDLNSNSLKNNQNYPSFNISTP